MPNPYQKNGSSKTTGKIRTLRNKMLTYQDSRESRIHSLALQARLTNSSIGHAFPLGSPEVSAQ